MDFNIFLLGKFIAWFICGLTCFCVWRFVKSDNLIIYKTKTFFYMTYIAYIVFFSMYIIVNGKFHILIDMLPLYFVAIAYISKFKQIKNHYVNMSLIDKKFFLFSQINIISQKLINNKYKKEWRNLINDKLLKKINDPNCTLRNFFNLYKEMLEINTFVTNKNVKKLNKKINFLIKLIE